MRRGFSMVEVLVALGLFALLIGVLVGVMSYSDRSSSRVGARIALQQTGRRAFVQFLQELQEGIEVITPRPGCTLPYAVVRDKLSLARWYYLLPSAGGKSFELWRYVDDPERPPAQREELLLPGVHRLAFTARSEGALQIHLLAESGDQDASLLTTIRLRNIAEAEQIW